MIAEVIDNFLENPEEERALALRAEYKLHEHNGLKYRGIAMTENKEHFDKIEKFLGTRDGKFICTWRRYLDDEENETYIHSDNEIGDVTGVLFLNPPEQCQGGISFWRHKLYGWAQTPTQAEVRALGLRDNKELWDSVLKDGFDEFKWQMIEYVPMEFNRLVLFHSKMFHSRYPQKAFGKTTEDGRLIKTFFYKLCSNEN